MGGCRWQRLKVFEVSPCAFVVYLCAVVLWERGVCWHGRIWWLQFDCLCAAISVCHIGGAGDKKCANQSFHWQLVGKVCVCLFACVCCTKLHKIHNRSISLFKSYEPAVNITTHILTDDSCFVRHYLNKTNSDKFSCVGATLWNIEWKHYSKVFHMYKILYSKIWMFTSLPVVLWN